MIACSTVWRCQLPRAPRFDSWLAGLASHAFHPSGVAELASYLYGNGETLLLCQVATEFTLLTNAPSNYLHDIS